MGDDGLGSDDFLLLKNPDSLEKDPEDDAVIGVVEIGCRELVELALLMFKELFPVAEEIPAEEVACKLGIDPVFRIVAAVDST